MRAFIAIEFSQVLHNHLHSLQRHLAEVLGQTTDATTVLRWTVVENIHLTLRFLGDSSTEQIHQISRGLSELAPVHGGFGLTLAGIGCFPNMRRPNIVWVGIGGQLQKLTDLQRQIEQLARAAGFAAEERPFSPHLTIGRARKDASPAQLGQVGRVLQGAATSAPIIRWHATVDVRSITLMQSDLRPTGAIYMPITRVDLGSCS
jgi:2'-5' RNA ligase